MFVERTRVLVNIGERNRQAHLFLNFHPSQPPQLSVWISLTFHRSGFQKLGGLKENEVSLLGLTVSS